MLSIENSACTLKIYSGNLESGTCLRRNIYIIHIDFYTMFKDHLLHNDFLEWEIKEMKERIVKEKIHTVFKDFQWNLNLIRIVKWNKDNENLSCAFLPFDLIIK